MIDRTRQHIRFFNCPNCKAEVEEDTEACYICGFKMPLSDDDHGEDQDLECHVSS